MEERLEMTLRRRGLVKKHVGVDYEVWRWKQSLEQSRGGAKRVTKNEVKNFAMEAYKMAGINNFKASDGWYRRWRIRWKLSNVVNSLDKNNVSETGQIICGPQPFAKSDLETNNKELPNNEKEINAKGGSLLKNDRSEANKSYVQVENSISQSESITSSFKPKFSTDTSVSSANDEGTKQTATDTYSVEIEPSGRANQWTGSSDNTDYLVNPTHEVLDITVYCNDLNKYVFDPSSSTNGKLTENHTSDVFDVEFVTSISNENNESIAKEWSKSSDNQRADELTKDEEEHGSCRTIDLLQTNGKPDLQKEEGRSGYDSGITVHPSSAASNECQYVPPLSSLFHHNGLGFEDHDLFCDSCEDFHPQSRDVQTCCHKQMKVTKEHSFLNGVLEKKDESLAKNPVKKLDSKLTNKSNNEDIRLKTPSIVLPKGKRYLVQFKNKVVNYALNYNVNQAASKYNVNRGTVSEWLAEHKRLSGDDSSHFPAKNQNNLLSDDCDFLKWLEESKFNLTNERVRQKTTEWLEENEDNTRCQWLRMYAHRLNGTEDSSIKKRYIAYPDVFKRIAVFHAQTHSNMAAARVFGVARRRILEWTQISGKIKEKESTVTAANNVTDEGVDKLVFEWYQNQAVIPPSKQVRCKAVELYRAAGHERIQCGSQWYYRWRARHKLPSPRSQLYGDFRLVAWVLSELDHNRTVTHSALAAQAAVLGHPSVSRGWTFRFCKKHHKLLVALPEPTTSLPSAMELQVVKYREHLHNTVKAFNYTNTNIIAMDEIPLHFLPKDQGKKPLLVRRPGFESCQASLVVSCLSDGTLLPSMFVFKGAVPTCNSDPLVMSTSSDTGVITEDSMLLWLSNVCFKQLHGIGGVLITDCFNVHTSQPVQQALTDHHVTQAVIPEGCAFKLLPAIRVCMLFKSMLEELCQVFLANQMTTIKTPSPDQLYHWAVRVHRDLAKHQKEDIRAAFNKMLLCNSPTV
uniref:HTH CENPB-type domain-containing protein n=1 Tax=Graphocephala atropunctata TaxID=36148 RepID=A0A1B6LTQ0_9HEMI